MARNATAQATLDEATEAVLHMSRALVGVAARSLAATEDRITLVQYRALVVLSVTGDQIASSLAQSLEVQASTVTRLCDRLVANGYIHRTTSAMNRREVTISLSEKGRALVRAETARRRRAIRAIVARLEPETQAHMTTVLNAVAEAAATGSDHAWKLGWTS